MSRAITIVFASILISACATGPMLSPFKDVRVTNEKLVEVPPVGQYAEGYLGDALLTKYWSTTGPAYAVKEGTITQVAEGYHCYDHQPLKFLADASAFIARKYVSEDPNTNEDLLCSDPLEDGKIQNYNGVFDQVNPYLNSSMICKDLTNESFYFVAPSLMGSDCLYGDPILWRRGVFAPGAITEVQKEVKDATNVKLELIYNGRVGDAIKFIYREFNDGLARPSFTQEIQYDLSRSSIIGFKEARLEVIEATNTVIRYRVNNHFF